MLCPVSGRLRDKGYMCTQLMMDRNVEEITLS